MKRNESVLNKFNLFWAIVQGLLTILVVVFSILCLFFGGNYTVALEMISSLDLLVIAYNNYKIYKKSSLTILYLVTGIVLFCYSLLTIFGVI